MALFQGKSWADVIEGTDLADLILGNGGNDLLLGGKGNDIILGGLGNDTIEGGRGHDTIAGNDGDDELRGGRGDDSVSGDDGDDLLYGGDGDDTVDGGNGNDFLYAGRGNDLMIGGAGNDWFFGSSGADDIEGGSGFDLVDYSLSSGAVRVFLSSGNGYGGDAQGDSYDEIEAVIGSAFNDYLIGNQEDNVFLGGEGRDLIDGGGGADVLWDGAGNDTVLAGWGDDLIFAGEGADRVDGGSGYDTLDFSDSFTGVNANLTTGKGQYGTAEGDSYQSIENLIGTDFGDILVGNALRNELRGGGGADFLHVGTTNNEYEGMDLLDGGNGADRMFGDAGRQHFIVKDSDSVSGGGGEDILDFTKSGGHGWSIDMEDGLATQSYLTDGSAFTQNTLTFSAMHEIRATDDDDFITGDAAGTRIFSYDGDDYINGGAGDDRIDPGIGANDIVLGGAGDDLLILTNRPASGSSIAEGGHATLVGGDGADGFAFNFDSFSTQMDRATILDFDRTEGDRIAFRSNDMVFIGDAEFVGGGAVETRIEAIGKTDSHFRVEMDRSGNGFADMSFNVVVEDGLGALTASDFDFIFS